MVVAAATVAGSCDDQVQGETMHTQRHRVHLAC
jgi:hypothetical protein